MAKGKKAIFAVYGTLRQGWGNHRILQGKSKLLGTHVTEPAYTMYSLGGFPAVTKDGTTPITIEVYEVEDPQTIERVHNLEGYTGEPDHPDNWYDVTPVETPYGVANMFYFKNPPKHGRQIESGDWKNNKY